MWLPYGGILVGKSFKNNKLLDWIGKINPQFDKNL